LGHHFLMNTGFLNSVKHLGPAVGWSDQLNNGLADTCQAKGGQNFLK
jgi:hypothetical protein